ncbi:hypothetical protein D9758_004985 [Tetrapyrgos nigripes]|uniref:MULE transposase domain-containing protein n=1 Tax=Tetrapyrgos nigripes TaxID=182062 RepID=A0A8H5LWT4_9AGAR|nr:hypothetical protein D9758_004985 [Tetrapyrgos nigripes]
MDQTNCQKTVKFFFYCHLGAPFQLLGFFSMASPQNSTETHRCSDCLKDKPLTAEFFNYWGGKLTKVCSDCLAKSKRKRASKKSKLNQDKAPTPETATGNSESMESDQGDQLDLEVDLEGVSEIPLEDFKKSIEGEDNIHSFAAQVNISGLQGANSKDLRTKGDQVAALVWEVTELRFLYHSKYEHKQSPLIRFKYHCAQQDKRQHKSSKTESATHRDKVQMHSFSCKGWLYVTVYDDEPYAEIQLKHGTDHSTYAGQDVPSDIRNILIILYVKLWTEILKKHPHPLFKRRAIYRIAANAKCQQWFRDQDELKSAKILLDECQNSANRYTIAEITLPNVDGYNALAFSLPDVLAKFGGRVREILLDSAWNTNGSHYELYALLGEVYGSGCPLGYLLLQSPKSGEEGVKQKYIQAFLEHFKEKYELNPSFTLTDKDLSEINAFLQGFPNAKHQLCFWHCFRAVKQRLSILRRQPKFYNVTEARNEFGDAIDKDFVPIGQVDDTDCVDFAVAQNAIPRVTVRLNGVLQGAVPPKPRFVIRINGGTRSLDPESPEPEPNVESSDSGKDEEDDYMGEDQEFSGDDDTDDEFGPDWMFDNVELAHSVAAINVIYVEQ